MNTVLLCKRYESVFQSRYFCILIHDLSTLKDGLRFDLNSAILECETAPSMTVLFEEFGYADPVGGVTLCFITTGVLAAEDDVCGKLAAPFIVACLIYF